MGLFKLNSRVPFILILALLFHKTIGNKRDHNNDQARVNLLKDFRPSRLLSETRTGPDGTLVHTDFSRFSNKQEVSQRSPVIFPGTIGDAGDLHYDPSRVNNSLKDLNPSHLLSATSKRSPQNPHTELNTEGSGIQGRIFGGSGGNGWSSGHSNAWGIGGSLNQCQNLHSYNPGCCNQGYKNCCHGGGGQGVKPLPNIGTGWGWQVQQPGNGWKVKGQPQYHDHHHPQQPVHHNPHPHHQVYHRPRPQVPLHAISERFLL